VTYHREPESRHLTTDPLFKFEGRGPRWQLFYFSLLYQTVVTVSTCPSGLCAGLDPQIAFCSALPALVVGRSTRFWIVFSFRPSSHNRMHSSLFFFLKPYPMWLGDCPPLSFYVVFVLFLSGCVTFLGTVLVVFSRALPRLSSLAYLRFSSPGRVGTSTESAKAV